MRSCSSLRCVDLFLTARCLRAALLTTLREKIKFDSSFSFHNRGQDEIDFMEFRKKLDGIFKAVTKLHPELVAQYVSNLVIAVDSMNDPLEMESVLHLLNIFGDNPTGTQAAFVADLLTRLAQSKIFNYPQPHELCGEFFECCHRYAQCISSRTDLFPRLLDLWMSDRGILHPVPAVRANRSSLFCFFVKKLKQALHPFLGLLVDQLKPAVEYNPPLFRRDDEGNTDIVDSVSLLTIGMQNDLFESISLLVGVTSGGPGLDVSEKQRSFLEALVTPLIQKIMHILEKQLWKQDSVYQPLNLTWLCNLIHAVGIFAKGFASNPKTTQPVAVQYYSNALPIVLQTLTDVGPNDMVRSKVIYFMHRMIPCLGSGPLVPQFPRIVELLLSNANVKQTTEVVTLIVSSIITFKEALAGALDGNGLLIKVLQHVMGMVTASLSRSTRGEDEREALELKRAWFSLVNSVAINNLINVFASPNSVANLNDVLQALTQGMSSFEWPIVGDCAAVFAVMVEQWTRPGALAGFDEFVYKQLLKNIFEVLFNPQYNLTDAKPATEIMVHFGSVFKELYKNRNVECEQYLQGVLLPQINCPPDIAAQFVDRLRASPDKQFGVVLKSFIESRRQ